MATRASSFHRHATDHFEPQDTDDDPHAQRRMRGQLEQIDYTAFASNTEVIGAVLGHADAQKFQRMAVAAAMARAQWVKEALALSEAISPSHEQISRLGRLRQAYEELAEAYEAMRRMVERGYLPYQAPAKPPAR
ncbi:MAG: hypothetical protein Q8N10_02780 [Phenylobacterium sp.]|uniref:hypothetical protein n=1 Tax=Phenylobacterium sp. TaxID=1871053 RepID=UPI00271700B2|nr:hypothetical protein [Phenylobacterium sp.]MDO8911599.1 hypothetical protein [Phenylobacterium sp.]MDP3099407.1 hypothetical protein [Phenylobacterium sp.]